MGEIERKALRVRAPTRGACFRKDVTATAGSVDLTSYVGKYVTIYAKTNEVFVYTASSQANAELLDDTATSGSNQCGAVPAGGALDFEVDATNVWLGYKCAATLTATLRIWISSERY